MKALLPLLLAGQLFAQSNSYLGPKEKVTGDPHLVRVEVRVNDSPQPSGLEIKSAQFDGEEVPLKPRDLLGYRGAASFQKPAGSYTLIWTVNRDRSAWPRTVTHQETVIVSPRDLWIQVTIEGEQVSIR